MSKKAGSLFTTAYLWIMFGIYPLYVKEGYTSIGEDKFRFFLYSSLAALVILLLIAVAKGVADRTRIYLINWERVSTTDILVLMYATTLFLSFAFSDFQKEALWGTQGWKMGLITQLLMCGLYFLISRLWDGAGAPWYGAVAISGVVCLLAILDRFGIYVLSLENRYPDFLSTMGNINWLNGYLTVTIPIGVCLFLLFENKILSWLSGIYIVIAFSAAFAQGASSIFLFFGALFFILLWIALYQRDWMIKWFLMVSLWGFSAQAIRLLRMLLKDAYSYETNNPCGYFTDSDTTLWIGLVGLGIYLFLRYQQRKNKEVVSNSYEADFTKAAHRLMAFGIAIVFGLWLFLSIWNTLWGIPKLYEAEAFLLNDSWGNGRGATFRTGFWTFKEMTLTHKLLGAGPDCFSAQAYAIPEIAVYLRNYFGNSRLTNAHNELLTCLVNTGIIGLALYTGIFLSFLVRGLRKAKEEKLLYIPVVCIFCYLIHNMISFAQILNFPLVILILAMGEKLLTNPTNVIS